MKTQGNTRNPRQARENAPDQVAITLIGYVVDTVFFFNLSQNLVKKTSENPLKSALS